MVFLRGSAFAAFGGYIRQSNTKVYIDINSNQYDNVIVSDGGAGKYNISFTTGTKTISGTVNGKIFD